MMLRPLSSPLRLSLAKPGSRNEHCRSLRAAAAALSHSSDTPRLDAELLMAHALGTTRSELLLRHMRDPAPASFAPLLARRLAHEPVAYILGHQEFRGLAFRVTPDVLIPRGDSEVLVEAALAARPGAAARARLRHRIGRAAAGGAGAAAAGRGDRHRSVGRGAGGCCGQCRSARAGGAGADADGRLGPARAGRRGSAGST